MRRRAIRLAMIAALSLPFGSRAAQVGKWKIEQAEQGRVTVKSAIYDQVVGNGKAIQMVEYQAETITHLDIESFISILKNAANHSRILQNEVSREIAVLSGTETLVYYFFDFPWPMENSDCVVKMVFTRSVEQGWSEPGFPTDPPACWAASYNWPNLM